MKKLEPDPGGGDLAVLTAIFAAMVAAFVLLSGCAPNVDEKDGICDGIVLAAEAHRDALLEDGGDESLTTGVVLLDQLKAACAA